MNNNYFFLLLLIISVIVFFINFIINTLHSNKYQNVKIKNQN